jgi:hypothetical protein
MKGLLKPQVRVLGVGAVDEAASVGKIIAAAKRARPLPSLHMRLPVNTKNPLFDPTKEWVKDASKGGPT